MCVCVYGCAYEVRCSCSPESRGDAEIFFGKDRRCCIFPSDIEKCTTKKQTRQRTLETTLLPPPHTIHELRISAIYKHSYLTYAYIHSDYLWRSWDSTGGDDGRRRRIQHYPGMVGRFEHAEHHSTEQPSWDGIGICDGAWSQHGAGVVHQQSP